MKKFSANNTRTTGFNTSNKKGVAVVRPTIHQQDAIGTKPNSYSFSDFSISQYETIMNNNEPSLQALDQILLDSSLLSNYENPFGMNPFLQNFNSSNNSRNDGLLPPPPPPLPMTMRPTPPPPGTQMEYYETANIQNTGHENFLLLQPMTSYPNTSMGNVTNIQTPILISPNGMQMPMNMNMILIDNQHLLSHPPPPMPPPHLQHPQQQHQQQQQQSFIPRIPPPQLILTPEVSPPRSHLNMNNIFASPINSISSHCSPASEMNNFDAEYRGFANPNAPFMKTAYVCSVYDEKVMAAINNCEGRKYEYYVPPQVDDDNYFGGQQGLWQYRIMQSMKRLLPDIWLMQGVKELPTEIADWSNFSITSKLRFCCRKCKRPWTSMRGKIVFAFKLNRESRRGFIMMKIFGQVCTQNDCTDKTFQTPACYPEEIHRVMWKLSEYIGHVFYGLPLSVHFFIEPDKAFRVGNPSTPHRKEYCQACQQGVCSKSKESSSR